MSAEYKKILAPHYKCPICGKLNCKGYGSSKSERKIFKRLVRNKLKVAMFKELNDQTKTQSCFGQNPRIRGN